MVVTGKKAISLVYELKNGNTGELIEKVEKSAPLSFICGAGQLLQKFEQNIEGLEPGEKFEFTLESADAYGEKNPDALVELPITSFEVNGEIDQTLLQVGKTIPMQDSNGNRMNGTVTGFDDKVVKMDFNHPLAGMKLHFAGEITEIRDATEEELSHGHIHKEGGCGCGGGGCGC